MSGYLMGAGGALFLLWAGWAFNQLIRLRNQVRAGWSDIDVQLQRRHDLVPQLVSAVQGYAAHEKALLEAVSAMRAQAQSQTQAGGSPAQRSEVEERLQRGLMELVAIQEAYPELKASQNFMQLHQQLVDTEDLLQHARRFYNGAVRDLNTAVETFPTLMIASAFNVQCAEFFQAQDRAAPVIRGAAA